MNQSIISFGGFSKAQAKHNQSLIKQLAFEQLNAYRFWLDVKEQNVPAKHLYESEHFIVEGTLRDCLKGENGLESLVVMPVLQGEWSSAYSIKRRKAKQ